MKNKTTKKHFEIFKEECEKWIDKFGLKGWVVRYSHVRIEKEDTLADCLYSVSARDCEIRLSTQWPIQVDEYRLRRNAFHEVCELFLGYLVSLAEYRYTTKSEIEEQTHAINRSLLTTFIKSCLSPSC